MLVFAYNRSPNFFSRDFWLPDADTIRYSDYVTHPHLPDRFSPFITFRPAVSFVQARQTSRHTYSAADRAAPACILLTLQHLFFRSYKQIGVKTSKCNNITTHIVNHAPVFARICQCVEYGGNYKRRWAGRDLSGECQSCQCFLFQVIRHISMPTCFMLNKKSPKREN